MIPPASNTPSRCQYRNAAGRQCRATDFGADVHLCPRHAALEQQFSHSPKDLTKLFAADHDEFRSPEGIQAALSEIFTLLAEDRVSARRAAVLAYISSLLLRTHSVIQQEAADQAAAAQKAPPRIIWNIPRPSHERHGAVNPAQPPPTSGAQL